MKRLIVIGLFVFLLAVVFVWLIRPNNQLDLGKPRIVASFYPLAYLAQLAGNDRFQVNSLMPVGADPHSFEPSPQDIVSVKTADLFIYHGAGLDVWADKLVVNLPTSGPKVIRITDAFALQNKEGKPDPHIWLDPVLARQIYELIAEELKKIGDNEGIQSDLSDQRVGLGDKKLLDLHRAFQNGLQSCKLKKFVVAHSAFGYLAKQYDLEEIPIASLSPHDEPSARRLGELADLVKAENIHYIFFEELTSPKLAQTLADEVGAETLVLNPIEGLTKAQQAAGEDYISLMRNNLENLRVALDCE